MPTLSALSSIPLPPSQAPHPASGNPKPYTKHARRSIQKEIQAAVEATAADRVTKIMSLSSWEEKQDAVDELFESVEEELRNSDSGRMSVLAAQPKFGDWVEASLERYLKNVAAKAGEGESGGEDAESSPVEDANATPVFMDVLEKGEDGSEGTPRLVRPLQSHHKEGTGRMVEEWDLAANKATKRIMVRQCVRDIAQILEEAGKEGSDNVPRRVYVKGNAGVGKVSFDPDRNNSILRASSSLHISLTYFPNFHLFGFSLYFCSIHSVRCTSSDCGVGKKVGSDCLVSSRWRSLSQAWKVRSSKQSPRRGLV